MCCNKVFRYSVPRKKIFSMVRGGITGLTIFQKTVKIGGALIIKIVPDVSLKIKMTLS